MGQPVYVYGVSWSGAAPPRSQGLDGCEVRSVAEDGLAAFVSDAPPGEIETTRDRLITHARILEEIADEETVLPMRFGVVAPSEEALREALLAPRRKDLAKLLDRFTGLAEMDVRVHYEESAVLPEIARRSPAVRALQKAVRGRPRDATYYDRIRLGEAVAEAMRALAAHDAERIVSVLRPIALEARRDDQSSDLLVLNAAFLLRRGDVARFRRAAGDLEADGRMRVRVTGPMPPYSFVDMKLQPGPRRRRRWGS